MSGVAACELMTPAKVQEIEFYSKSDLFPWLSNFSPHPITDTIGRTFGTLEAWYQFTKLSGLSGSAAALARDRILATPPTVGGALEAKMISKTVVQSREGWARLRSPTMWTGLCLKFAQHPSLLKLLLRTGEARLVHRSNSDRFWGVVTVVAGPAGGVGIATRSCEGQNELGVLLTRLRTHLRDISSSTVTWSLEDIRAHVRRNATGCCPHDYLPADCFQCGPIWRRR